MLSGSWLGVNTMAMTASTKMAYLRHLAHALVVDDAGPGQQHHDERQLEDDAEGQQEHRDEA